ncbi:hypothetical protein MMC12_005284 [Toensbergia leucococca]|nr:hypothetical protein [Toensbergia leucococca]
MPVRREEPDDVSSQTQNVNLDAMGFEASEDIPDPYDWRHLPDLPSNSSSPTAVRLHSWVRTTTPLSTPSPLTHLAALALLTDSWFIETVNLVDPLSVGPRSEKVALETSLNHVVHFHEPLARADEWMFVERTSSWAGRNRGHVEQRIWGRGGNLLVSSWQEGVVRLRRREGKL